jgi:hypothetical protein
MPGKSQPAERHFRYDAFLSHNSQNKPVVRELKQHLTAAHLKVWFDEDELRPGIPWQELLEAGIHASQSVVVIVGADGLGPWEDEEMQGALRLAVKDKRPVIPVLLPGAPSQPELPMFLGNRTWVDLRNGLSSDGLERLKWGITGRKGIENSGPPEPAEPPEPSPLPPPPPSQPLVLNQILPGQWQVQIQFPFPPGVNGQLRVEMLANGMFNGQLMTPLGLTTVQGQWQANPLTSQIGLQGMQTNGFQTMPYVVLVQVGYFDRQRITGVTSAGEQVAWQRMA